MSSTSPLRSLLLLLLLVLAGLPAGAAAESRALVVGVSNYPEESVGDLQLAGPKHDAALMIDTLEKLGTPSANITVLADGLEETSATRKADGEPTKAAIMAALADLASRSSPGDFVTIYMSGHGSQQPASLAATKADGLEEIFLPIDIGPWEDAISTVKNALVDRELGAAVTAIRARGAQVFVVIDACHSGTMTRKTGDSVPRQVPPSVLGIPAEAMARAGEAAKTSMSPATRGLGPAAAQSVSRLGVTTPPAPASRSTVAPAGPAAPVEPGGYVAFFAAWPDQVALQKALPRGYGAGERRPHGVLTFYLAQAIRGGKATTFRDLAHQVMAGYDQFGQAPTPMFEGDLAAALPGVTAGIARWPVTVAEGRVTVGAGAIDGLGPGAIVALATAEDPATIRAFARVTEAGTARAGIEAIERDGKTVTADLFREPLLATLVEGSADFVLSVATPPSAPGDAASRMLAAAIDGLAGSNEAGLRFVAPGDPADLRLFLEEGRLWLAPDDTGLVKTGRSQTPSLALPPRATNDEAARMLRPALTGFARARNLIRVAGVVGTGPVAASLTIDGFVIRDSGLATGARAPDDRACPALAAERLPDGARPLGDAMPELGHCDTLYFRIANTGRKLIDVTPLYIDGAGGIAYMGPPEGLRLEPGLPPRLVPIRIVTFSQRRGVPLPIGQERLLFIAVEIEKREALPADFRYLAQAAPTTVATRAGGAPGKLRALLEGAAFGTLTRSAGGPGTLGAAGMTDFRWRVVAPDGVR